MRDNRAIGVFDSGVGGLTVLRALHDRLPNESTIYLGDLARCPYGTRPQDEVRLFARQIADLLVEEDIKLLVIACNTATAAAYHDLHRRYDIPVIGVVDPGAEAAVRMTHNRRIGVVATDGTVASGAYRRAIRARLPEATVVERSASGLVPIIECGPPARPVIEAQLHPLLAEMRARLVDVLILGCTHFPLVRDIFEAEIGSGIVVLDSAETTAAQVGRLLRQYEMEASGPPNHRLLVTGPAEAFSRRAEAMFRLSPLIETVTLELDPVG